jgi:hypothetical protein
MMFICLLTPIRHGLVIDDGVGPRRFSFSNFSSLDPVAFVP